MLEESKSTAGKSYTMGDVGPNAKVQQGENLRWVEAASTIPDSNSLIQQFKKLIEQISHDPKIDDDTRDISVKKTEAVAENLANAQKSPKDLYQALLDGKSWFSHKAVWVWDELSKIMQSDTAQKTIGTITENTIKGAIQGLTGST